MHFDEESSLKKHLDDVAKVTVEGAAARRVTFNGFSMNPSIFPGAIVKVKGFDNREYGSYMVTMVDHHYSIGGNYHNSFTAIPSDVKASPHANPTLVPRCDPQACTVEKTNDPDGFGRVQVRLYWQKDTVTPWIRIAMPYTGSDKGMYFVPEKGEEVMVGFEGGNAEMPFVIGALYHGKAKPDSFKNDKNDLKAIKTRSGHTIEFNDKDGKEMITIKDKDGDIIEFDTSKKTITITAADKLNLNAKEINITADKKLTMSANEISASGKTKVELTSSANFKIDGKILEVSGTKTDIKGTSVNISGDAMTNVKGGLLNLN
jgi:phage baseplate assembly protein V